MMKIIHDVIHVDEGHTTISSLVSLLCDDYIYFYYMPCIKCVGNYLIRIFNYK